MMLSLILPTYNERDCIIELINALEENLSRNRIDYEIIIVDDHSPDGTAELVEERFKETPHIRCIVRNNQRGLASAIKMGILNSSGQILLFMDTDFNHNPSLVSKIVSLTSSYDIISGSRYIPGGGMLGPVYRYWGSFLFNLFVRLTLGLKTRDNLSGFVAFRRDILKDFNLDDIFRGYGDYYIRFLYRARELNLKVLEIPVIYKLRYGGNSKTNFLKHTFKYILTVINIKFKSILKRENLDESKK